MWQKLILTAGSDSQNDIFKKQLSLISTEKYCEAVEVVTDESPGIRIGSGGATLSIIRRIFDEQKYKDLEGTKILLLHSGGLSQRMPHLSAYGKAFGTLTNNSTILETKLEIYKNDLIGKLPQTGGIMITASDVIEKMSSMKSVKSSEADIVIFGHLSSLEVGTQHGVFVMDEKSGQLKCVLQKASEEEMKIEGAIREDGMVVTDSCYFMSWKFCKRLLKNPLFKTPITEELCCYGDFMRPMGYAPKLDYLQNSSPKLKLYRKALTEVFIDPNVEISILGENSFFHFGTYQEFVESLLPESPFRHSFPSLFKSNIVHSEGINTIPKSSFIEYSTGVDLEVGENCISSGIDTGSLKIKLPSNTVIFTMSLQMKKYVTIIIKIDDDIKKKREVVRWNGHDTRIDGKSLWEAPIFEMFETRIKSLEATLHQWKNGMTEMGSNRISICEAVKRHDFDADLEWRRVFSLL
ncbi:hypothetical protein L3Y34_001813 [Caenorhabditis briggsae]|uniref:GDP-fucose pyrophosphorylase domain-containing protein n=1 Tax=Caenorhabditis briggsae TaxID=6238 RepID=A0AAE9IQR6_CAEBR|nr:hypothetical protein L3Y34_001813 [Caenorhabditis briggsae]